jgi:CheY-like chemotaxis protein
VLENRSVTIVIVEDDPGYTTLIEKNLRRGGIDNPIETFANGQAVLDYLKTREDYATNHYLLLLDLNMPVMNGLELLRSLKQDNDLCNIPVIVLTSSDDQREINECYNLGCNLYLPKPAEFHQFFEVIRELGLMIGLIDTPSFT